MANQLNNAQPSSPIDHDPAGAARANGNQVTAAYGTLAGGEWVSKDYYLPGTPNGAEEVALLFDYVFGPATLIEIVPEHATPDDPTTFYPMVRLDATGQLVLDTWQVLPGNMTLPGQTSFEISYKLKSGDRFRVRARSVAGDATTTLAMKIVAGGGGRRA